MDGFCYVSYCHYKLKVMKTILKYTVLLVIISFTIFMLAKIFSHIQNENAIKAKIETIPEFGFNDIYSRKVITDKNLDEDLPVLFIYLNTECNFCIDETEMICENIKEFRNCQIVIVSIEEPDILISYAEKYNLMDFDHLFFLYDRDLKFEGVFGKCNFPSSFVYGKAGELRKVIKGKARLNELLKYIKE